MKRVFSISLALTLGALATYGCEESDEDQLKELLDDYEVVVNDQVAVICDCWEELGHQTEAECKTMRGEILPAKRRCLDDAFAQDADISLTWAECTLPIEREYATCLNDKVTCDDLTSADPCVEDRMTGLNECITLPNSVTRDIDAC